MPTDVNHHQSLLFLCTGNYYRSRFAESLFNHLAAAHQLNWRADSRGLAIERLDKPHAMCPDARAALAAMGIAVAEPIRFPVAAADADFAAAHRIIALKEAEHRPLMLERHPAHLGRIEFWHIHDADVDPPEKALRELEVQVRQLISQLMKK